MLVDTHAHLSMKRFNNDRGQVIQRAKEAGLDYIVTIGTDLRDSQQAVAIADKYDFVYAAVGVHPHDVKNIDGSKLKHIELLANNKKTKAIGEIGLDFFRMYSPLELQKKWFIRQINLAKDIGLPIIIHSRESDQEVLKILKEEKTPELCGVIHCFSGDKMAAIEYLDMGFYISVAGPVTYNNSHQLQEIIREVPLDRLLLETDCPYLAPQNKRGERNEPAYVKFVADKIARLKGVEYREVATVTTLNAKKLFGLK